MLLVELKEFPELPLDRLDPLNVLDALEPEAEPLPEEWLDAEELEEPDDPEELDDLEELIELELDRLLFDMLDKDDGSEKIVGLSGPV